MMSGGNWITSNYFGGMLIFFLSSSSPLVVALILGIISALIPSLPVWLCLCLSNPPSVFIVIRGPLTLSPSPSAPLLSLHPPSSTPPPPPPRFKSAIHGASLPCICPAPLQDDIPQVSPLREKRADPRHHPAGLSPLAVSDRDSGE